jgi:lipopolysaccharide exporter
MSIPESTTESPVTSAPTIRPVTSFAGDVLRLVSGTTLAQFMLVAATPFLTRLYPPAAFGLFAIFLSITNILGVVVCLRYDLSIMLPEYDGEAANLLGVSALFAIVNSLLTAALIWWLQEPLLNFLNAQELAHYLWLVPVAVLGTGLFMALNYWQTRTKRYSSVSMAQVGNSTVMTASQLSAGYAGYANGGGLIGGFVGGKFIAVATLAVSIWRADHNLLLSSINVGQMVAGIKRHRKFPLFTTWAALLNAISWQLPAFLLAIYFSPAIVGFYALGHKVLSLPMLVIGQAIGQVFFQRSAEAHIKGALHQVVEMVFQRLVAFGLFPFLLITFIGQDLFGLVFGEEWAEAGMYAQILGVWIFVWFISSPMSTLFSVLEKQQFDLKLNSLIFFTRLLSLTLGGISGSVYIALLLFAGSGIVTYGYLIFAVIAEAGMSRLRAVKIIVRYFLYFLPVGLALLFLKFINIAIVWQLMFSAVATLTYYFYVIKSDLQIRLLMAGWKKR